MKTEGGKKILKGKGEKKGSGNWDCIGEISGAPVPSWKEKRWWQTLNFPIFLSLHPSPCIYHSALISKNKSKHFFLL
jgi:hypothetical protein